MSIDGRKEWTCKFRSEPNVWTRWRCRRCYSDILAGLRGKHRQAGEWSTDSTTSSGEGDRKTRSLEAENKELRATIDALEKKGGEGVQRGQGVPSRKEGDLEDVWGEDMDIEDENESRKKLDERKTKLQKELRDVERWSLISKEAQESIKEFLQHQLQGVEKRRHDLMLEHQKVQKKSQKIQSTQDKRRHLQKDSIAPEEEMRKLQEELKQKGERILFLSNKVDKNKMADAEMAAELQSLQAGEERRGSNASQTGDCCLEVMLQRVIALGRNGVEVLFQRVRRENGSGPRTDIRKRRRKEQ